jgi:hypothetical protein
MSKNFKSSSSTKISKDEITRIKPTHLKFNFSFITSNNTFCFTNDEFGNHKLSFLERIYELSQDDLVKVYLLSKNRGLETIEKIKRPITWNSKFEDAEFRKKEDNGKYTVFSVYPNNNPLPIRIFGKIIRNVYYIMFIDLKHELYDG